MKHIYAVETKEELLRYQKFVCEIQSRLNEYMTFLREEYMVESFPRAIVWTSREIATNLISDISIPAYTNEYRIIICPEIEVWRDIYLKQIDGFEESERSKEILGEVRDYYSNALSSNHIMQILGHELAHHSELFEDDLDLYYGDSGWFEEGMVEYISRNYFLTKKEYDEEVYANWRLVELYKTQQGNRVLDEVGQYVRGKDFASIFFDYWNSFLAVKRIVEKHNGDIGAAFRKYHEWRKKRDGQSLEKWMTE